MELNYTKNINDTPNELNILNYKYNRPDNITNNSSNEIREDINLDTNLTLPTPCLQARKNSISM